jgi:hypothetical protein
MGAIRRTRWRLWGVIFMGREETVCVLFSSRK